MALPPNTRGHSLPRPASSPMESTPDESPKRRFNLISTAAASQPSTSPSASASRDTANQPSLSTRMLQAMEQYPQGMVIVSQATPRTQAVVVGHVPSATGAPLLQFFQAGFNRPQSGDWHPPSLQERLLTKLPHQEVPPTATFAALDKVRSHLQRLYRQEASLTDAEVEPLISYLEQQRRPPNTTGASPELPHSSSFNQEPPPPVYTDLGPHTETYPIVPIPTDPHHSANQMQELTRRMTELDAFLRADRRAPHTPPPNQTPPLLPSPPMLYHDAASSRRSSRSTSHSRSRSRSRDRSLVRLRKYALINVPCPFSDLRAAIPPASRASGSARQRRFFRRILTDIYVFYPSALLLAQHIIALNRQTGSTVLTWEEATLLHWARALDYALLEANGGSWTLWSEPVVDCLLRGFLEMAIRANPDHEPPPGLDPSTAAKLRRLKFGKSRDYGPLPRPQTGGPTNNNRNRRNNYYRGNDRTSLNNQPPAGQPATTAPIPSFGGAPRRSPNPPSQ